MYIIISPAKKQKSAIYPNVVTSDYLFNDKVYSLVKILKSKSVDEIQNLAYNEIHNVVTRIGRNSALVLAGDFDQSDLDVEESGVKDFYEIAKKIQGFKIVTFQERDIVRNDFIKDYIIAKNQYDKERKERKIFNGHAVQRDVFNNIVIAGQKYALEATPVN